MAGTGPTPVAATGLVPALRRVVGEGHVLTDPDLTAPYGRDWTGRFGVPPYLVVRPADTAAVADVLRLCRDAEVAVVPQGGGTGLVGGSVPHRPGRVVLSTVRLTGLSPVSATGQVTAGAGVTVTALARHVGAAGWAYGVDLASRDTATVGGTLATNAGGVRVVLHGDTRSQVLGVTAVLADGSVVSRLDGWPKDSSGYDLSRLFVGSEGTLGVITAARLRLVEPLPAGRVTVLAGVASMAAAVELAAAARRRPGQLLAAEFVTGAVMQQVVEVSGLPFPLRAGHPVHVLLEVADPAVAEAVLRGCDDVAVDPRLWAYRERASEALSALGVVHHLDVAVPVDRLDELLDRLPSTVAPARAMAFGHLLEGNVHVCVLGVPPDDDRADEAVLRLVAGMGGSVSSEHGVGAAKARWLPLSRSAEEITTMRRIKDALDPRGVMNPGVVLAR